MKTGLKSCKISKGILFLIVIGIHLSFTHKFADDPDKKESVIKTGEKPNVLFIAIDDLNDWVGCMGGNPQVKTPNLDSFHDEGAMVMYRAHAPATVCCPSRSALLTGVNAYKTGVYGNRNNLKYAPKAKDLVTMPEYFSLYGYTSLTMGKIFHRHNYPDRPTDAGQWAFDEYYSTRGGVGPISDQRPVNGLPNLEDENPSSYHYTAFDWGPTKGNDETQMLDYKTASWAADQFQNRDFDKPFFMAVGISKPHLSWYVPQKYFDMYPLDEIVVPEYLPDDFEDILKANGDQAFGPQDTWRRVEKYGRHKEAVQAYLATITFVDDCVGVLLNGLANSQYADNTIVVILGDHGWHLGEKMKYGKTQLWQESCRVPLMVKVPGVTPNSKRCDGVVNLIDLYPTLVDLCGLPANPVNDGRSFSELLHNPDMEWNFPTLTTNQYKEHRIFDGRYSYIYHMNKDVEQFYDHQTDSMEWTNLVNDPAYTAIKVSLKALIPETNEAESPRNDNLPPINDDPPKRWVFPGDSVMAWQYDYNINDYMDTLFSLDSAKTIGIYGCNDISGNNIRSYDDAGQFQDAAQFKWDASAHTFARNGQWIEYSVHFGIRNPSQLIVRARDNPDANFKLTIKKLDGDTVFFQDLNLFNDFNNLEGGNDLSDWFLSKFEFEGLWGKYLLRFDWYDHLGDPGIFGEYTFVESTLDLTPPGWFFVSIGIISSDTDIQVMTDEDAMVYLVPSGTLPDASTIRAVAVSTIAVTANLPGEISTRDLTPGDYIAYAIDISNNISVASGLITLETPASKTDKFFDKDLIVAYYPINNTIEIVSTTNFSQVRVYNIQGQQVLIKKCFEKTTVIPVNKLQCGVYLVQVFNTGGSVINTRIKII